MRYVDNRIIERKGEDWRLERERERGEAGRNRVSLRGGTRKVLLTDWPLKSCPIVNIMGPHSSAIVRPTDWNRVVSKSKGSERFQLSMPATVVVGSSVPRIAYVVSIPAAKRVELIK